MQRLVPRLILWSVFFFFAVLRNVCGIVAHTRGNVLFFFFYVSFLFNSSTTPFFYLLMLCLSSIFSLYLPLPSLLSSTRLHHFSNSLCPYPPVSFISLHLLGHSSLRSLILFVFKKFSQPRFFYSSGTWWLNQTESLCLYVNCEYQKVWF